MEVDPFVDFGFLRHLSVSILFLIVTLVLVPILVLLTFKVFYPFARSILLMTLQALFAELVGGRVN